MNFDGCSGEWGTFFVVPSRTNVKAAESRNLKCGLVLPGVSRGPGCWSAAAGPRTGRCYPPECGLNGASNIQLERRQPLSCICSFYRATLGGAIFGAPPARPVNDQDVSLKRLERSETSSDCFMPAEMCPFVSQTPARPDKPSDCLPWASVRLASPFALLLCGEVDLEGARRARPIVRAGRRYWRARI